MTPPTIGELGEAASEIVWRVMGKGSEKSGYGQWFAEDKPTYDYHIQRAIRHNATAQMQIHLNHPQPDNGGETAIDHLERAIVRSLFAWAQLKRELPRL